MFFSLDSKSVIIESEESKNQKLQSVFNEIRWIPGSKQDVWMMNQSHYGRNPKTPDESGQPHEWERLAIVIDKTTSPLTAQFYQLKSGPLEWSEDLKTQTTSFRASCFICHNNGPRAIRPAAGSPLAFLNWKDQIKIFAWNLRIKTYGRIHYARAHDEQDPGLVTPFAYHGGHEDDLLKIRTCVKCHRESGFLARGFLRRQQSGTIRSMVDRGHMPPAGFSMTALEKKQLEDFLRGF